MRWLLVVLLLSPALARADKSKIKCDDTLSADITVDGLLDEWVHPPAARVAGVSLHCAWDGSALALAVDVVDDKIIRVRGPAGKAHEDHVDVRVSAGGKPVALTVYPGNAIAKSRIIVPRKVIAADALQAKGFALETVIEGTGVPGLGASTPSIDVHVVFHDADAATGGADSETTLDATIELADRKDLLDDFLRTVHLKKSDVRLDTLAELDPDRKGQERLVAGGTAIGVLTEQFAYVSLPAASAADVLRVELLPLGLHGQQVVAATVRQRGNGGTRDLLMLWAVWSGQLSPLVSIEVRKELGKNVLECGWAIAKGAKGPELRVTPKPAVGWTAETWNEERADDADAIVPPWDAAKSGIAYTLRGAEIARRDLPAAKPTGKSTRH